MSTTTLAHALAQAQACGLHRLDAQLLLLHACGRGPQERAWLIAHDTDVLPPDSLTLWKVVLARRLRGEPLAYITGHKAFYGLDLLVDARVLDPRADTETLVDWALQALPAAPQRVLDLGTGSGAVALALQHERRLWDVHALDYSAVALAVAQANALRLKLPVRFAQGNWLHGAQGLFHAIVSNPPYVAEGDPHLDALRHEPTLALTSGPDGLDAIRTIIASAPPYLHPGGWLLLEHGFEQAQAVCTLLAQAGFSHLESRLDLAGITRCSGGRWNAPPQA
jgi:release factor glutamine methyltransferase